jgi:uncharacterized surface protein with fasciclin (FAS1) repeats
MKSTVILKSLLSITTVLMLSQCEKSTSSASDGSSGGEVAVAGQSAVNDDLSQKDVVKVAVGSPDHTTLVAAVKAADLVDVLSNAGPFTVFAPTNAAFDKLPAGTVATLLKPENKEKLADILQYHVAVGGYKEEMLTDGKVLSMANGGSVKVTIKNGKITLNDSATLVGTVQASNGIVHVVDGVLLPTAP